MPGTARQLRLLPPAVARRLWKIVVPVLLSFGLLCWKVAGLRGSTGIDVRVDPRLMYRFQGDRRLFEAVITLGSPGNVAAASLALAGLCLAAGARRAAVFALVGPSLAGGLAEWVLKPLIDRRREGGLAFPSGHTTGAVAVAVVLGLLLLPGAALHRRLGGWLCAALWLVTIPFGAGVGLGVVVLDDHYATDVVGGAAVAVTVILVLAWALDAWRPGRTWA